MEAQAIEKTETHEISIRDKILTIEDKMREHPGAMMGDCCPLKHTFADGCYIREIFNPKGMLLVTKIHKIAHPFFLLKGDMSILTEEGIKRIKAPYHGITPAGTKRVIYAHEDIIFVTVHVTKETNLEKIEEEIIAKTFDDVPNPNQTEDAEIIEFAKEVSKTEEILCLG